MIFALLLPALTASVAAAGTAVLCLDDERVPLDNVYEIAGIVYLPAEKALEKAGGKVVWHPGSRRLTVRFGDRHASATLFSKATIVHHATVTMQAQPLLLGGRICLPAEFFERALPILTGRHVALSDLHPTPPPSMTAKLFFDQAAGRHRMLSVNKIVLDAGHGGRDPGARSPQGIREKDINLAITLALANRLRRETNAGIVLTRGDDTFIELPQRTRLANTTGADVFVSIHANGAYRRSATGFEVYFLSLTSSDKRAAALAAAENGPEIVLLPAMGSLGGGGDLNAILKDMIRTENLAASERLAVAMQARLDLAMNLENRGVKQAPFFVLAGAQMPAVLVEVGFVTNPQEAELLTRPDVQARIVDALVDAILYYDAVNALAE